MLNGARSAAGANVPAQAPVRLRIVTERARGGRLLPVADRDGDVERPGVGVHFRHGGAGPRCAVAEIPGVGQRVAVGIVRALGGERDRRAGREAAGGIGRPRCPASGALLPVGEHQRRRDSAPPASPIHNHLFDPPPPPPPLTCSAEALLVPVCGVSLTSTFFGVVPTETMRAFSRYPSFTTRTRWSPGVRLPTCSGVLPGQPAVNVDIGARRLALNHRARRERRPRPPRSTAPAPPVPHQD